MKPQRPYLLRAIYQWIVDSDLTPYLMVDASVLEVVVPLEHVKDNQIVLNLSPVAVQNLVMDNDFIMCDGRFDGRSFEMYLPMQSWRAIYCKENGKGLVFDPEEKSATAGPAEAPDGEDDPTPPKPKGGKGPGKPKLTVV